MTTDKATPEDIARMRQSADEARDKFYRRQLQHLQKGPRHHLVLRMWAEALAVRGLAQPAEIPDHEWALGVSYAERVCAEEAYRLAHPCTCVVDDPDCPDVTDIACPTHGAAQRVRAAQIEALEWVRLTKPNAEELDAAIENLKRGGT